MPDIRYGVFLRPDPATCFAQTQINNAVVQQFGLVSAAAFPPHATLVGNLRTNTTVDELIATVGAEISKTSPFPLHNQGIRSMGYGWVYDVHNDPTGHPNSALVDLANRLIDAVLPVSLDHDDYLTPTISAGSFRGHLSLASHDLAVDGHLGAEVGEFLQGLPVSFPGSFTAEVISLFEFTCDDWQQKWWHTLRWRHLHSWHLSDVATGSTPATSRSR